MTLARDIAELQADAAAMQTFKGEFKVFWHRCTFNSHEPLYLSARIVAPLCVVHTDYVLMQHNRTAAG